MNLQIAVSQLRRKAKRERREFFFLGLLELSRPLGFSGKTSKCPKDYSFGVCLGAQKVRPENSLGRKWAKMHMHDGNGRRQYFCRLISAPALPVCFSNSGGYEHFIAILATLENVHTVILVRGVDGHNNSLGRKTCSRIYLETGVDNFFSPQCNP